MPPPLSGGAGSVLGASVVVGRCVVLGASVVGGGGGSVGGGGGGVVVVVRSDSAPWALAASTIDAERRSAIRDVCDPAAASTRSLLPPPSGTMTLASSTGPTSRAIPATPPMIARRAVVRRDESSVLGGGSVRSDMGGRLFPSGRAPRA